ncbi:TniQ family protein [Nocardia rhamnosiphila]|uniref:TniQ family protein n=1 Tax=Nocardia rhamnosiphila TaxID=426716 RepID=A0ABV2WXM1_9NOCA
MRRWPLHPEPQPLEALISSLSRLATTYSMPHEALLATLDIADLPRDLDHDPPWKLLQALAERTGVTVDVLSSITMVGLVRTVTDTIWARESQRQQVFESYVRQHSIRIVISASPVGDPHLC